MLLYFLLFFFLSPTPQTQAQEPSPSVNLFETYKIDYLHQQKIYQETYLDYSKKKQIHTQYGTIITQKDKNEATIKTLIARNTMLKTYLMAIRVKMDKYESQNPIETEIRQIELSKLEEWLEEQNTIVSSINNESDISQWAQNFKEKYTIIQQESYSSLIQDEVNQKVLILEKIKKLAENIKNSSNIKMENQQWFSGIPIKSDLVIKSLNEAIEKTKKDQYSFNQNFQDFYPSAKADIDKANNYLTEMISDLKSIVIKFSN